MTCLTLRATDDDQQNASKNDKDKPPLRVALIGAGIFATNAHTPAIRRLSTHLQCVAIWSQSTASVEKLLMVSKKNDVNKIDGFFPRIYSGNDGWKQLLQQTDIDALIMALPMNVQLTYVADALQAGKHVLSEKPISVNLLEAEKMCDLYSQTHQSKFCWSVGENYRYEPAMLRMADIIKSGAIGNPFLMSLVVRFPFEPDNRYLKASWRKKPSWYGGLFPDACVHYAAMLRLVLGSEAKKISAMTSSRAEHIPSVDTMVASVEWENGVQGCMSVTFAPGASPTMNLDVTGSGGLVSLRRNWNGGGYFVTVNGQSEEYYSFGGIDGEFVAFADACHGGGCLNRNSPHEALKDLSFVEACLKSGQKGGECVELSDGMVM